jgi:hypothetical protein
MDFLHCSGAICAACILSWGVVAQADDNSPVALSQDFQIERLLTPSVTELAAEDRGSVYIYDSLEMKQINTALDQHFDRIENMMFIRIHHLPPTGTGPAEVEDDDCA